VLDPFTGTGSVLVSAAHLGALTMGMDIDMRVIKIGEEGCWQAYIRYSRHYLNHPGCWVHW
jgi:tRNA (guanine10-N2)-methyltransferase